MPATANDPVGDAVRVAGFTRPDIVPNPTLQWQTVVASALGGVVAPETDLAHDTTTGSHWTATWRQASPTGEDARLGFDGQIVEAVMLINVPGGRVTPPAVTFDADRRQSETRTDLPWHETDGVQVSDSVPLTRSPPRR